MVTLEAELKEILIWLKAKQSVRMHATTATLSGMPL